LNGFSGIYYAGRVKKKGTSFVEFSLTQNL